MPLSHISDPPPLWAQVSANLKLSEKKEVKKELVSGGGEGGTGQLPFLVLLSSGAPELGGGRGAVKAGTLSLKRCLFKLG